MCVCVWCGVYIYTYVGGCTTPHGTVYHNTSHVAQYSRDCQLLAISGPLANSDIVRIDHLLH